VTGSGWGVSDCKKSKQEGNRKREEGGNGVSQAVSRKSNAIRLKI